MKQLFLELGLYNTTLWMALACATCVAFRGRLPAPTHPLWRPVALLMILGSFANIGLGLGRAFISPRDLMQDIVSAKEYLAGRSMYPDGMTDRFITLLAEEDTNRKLDLGWTIGQLSDRSQKETLQQHWVQAHPPFMSVFFAGLYGSFGVLGTQIALALISMACLVWSVTALVGELRPEWGGWRTTALVAAACGSGPVVTSLRAGQVEPILLALLVGSWILLRRARGFPAGVAIGLAISFKLIPALLLPLLLIRWPRAFLGAVAAFGLVLTLIVLNVGDGVLEDYRRTAKGVIEEYAAYPSNISLLGFLARGFQFFGLSRTAAMTIWQGAGVLIAVGLMILAHRLRKRERSLGDADGLFALGVCLMPLCSPVCWDHYLTFLIMPLAITATRFPTPHLAAMVLVWTIPETAYLTVMKCFSGTAWEGVSVWVVAPLRTYALLTLAWHLALRACTPVSIEGRKPYGSPIPRNLPGDSPASVAPEVCQHARLVGLNEKAWPTP